MTSCCQARKAENTDPRTNYAVKYATAPGRLRMSAPKRKIPQFVNNSPGVCPVFAQARIQVRHVSIPTEMNSPRILEEYSENDSSTKNIPVFVRVRIQASRAFAQKSCVYWFCAGGY